jgi:hypothetical protein
VQGDVKNESRRLCEKCGCEALERSRSRSRFETWRQRWTGKKPFRCHNCGWRGWRFDPGPKFTPEVLETAERAMAPEPPSSFEDVMPLGDDTPNRDLNLNELE